MSREDGQSLRCLTSSKSKPRGHQRGMSKSKVKTVKLTLTVVLCYLLCWAPFFVVNMLTVWDESIAFEGNTRRSSSKIRQLFETMRPAFLHSRIHT